MASLVRLGQAPLKTTSDNFYHHLRNWTLYLALIKVILKDVSRLLAREFSCGFCSSLQAINLSKCSLSIHIFHLGEEGPSAENLEAEDENIVAANHWVLPAGILKLFIVFKIVLMGLEQHRIRMY